MTVQQTIDSIDKIVFDIRNIIEQREEILEMIMTKYSNININEIVDIYTSVMIDKLNEYDMAMTKLYTQTQIDNSSFIKRRKPKVGL